ncbi:DNA adenine methylase [Calothrix sp. NIES-2098]|uniref:DNA adenine methylase n=1 Tax=Calothrix sp. NIES-2098 TaxID=1954171 RepID=UPI000B5F8564|nr:putative DNA methyltransferase [Calothrix sp. NIES-2098]
MLKSPLRYPGGKSKALKKIIPYIPSDIKEYREPCVGGGSVFLAVKQRFGNKINRYWINDLNSDLCCFWLYAKTEIESLVKEVEKFKEKYKDGRELFNHFTNEDIKLSDFDRAVRFFILNRISFSGTVDSGGYSQQAFELRFTDSSINRLRKLSVHLSSVHITSGDYENLLFQEGEDVFIFLDPPYLSATKSKLYGLKGNLHTDFDHERFAQNIRKCPHRWLITYDNSPEIRKLFSFANINITEFTVQYGMNNYKRENAAFGQELIVRNYEIANISNWY